MRILWVCNIMLPCIAEVLGIEASNKEGWLSGLCQEIMKRHNESNIELNVAFPMPEMLLGEEDVLAGEVSFEGGSLKYYGFKEDTVNPHIYDEGLEKRLSKIAEAVKPDLIHCFGTEYPHTLAICRAYPNKDRILVGIQGFCSACGDIYYSGLPSKVVESLTFRDWLKKDSIVKQKEKFDLRGKLEIEAIKLAGNVTGRTNWDYNKVKEWNPSINYYKMNETLRSNFYSGQWCDEDAIPHSIFVSQGDYPIKGLHYMLLALPRLKERYSDIKVYVAGNSIVEYTTLKQKIKISAYGNYMRKIIDKYELQDNIEFLGRLSAEEMKDRYLKSSLFVCCSTVENSPNSLGEAMLLGMPCVSADVGGISSIFNGDEDGILYEMSEDTTLIYNNMCNSKADRENILNTNVEALINAISRIWENNEEKYTFCKNARKHAQNTHDAESNYARMTEIYSKIIEGKKEL